MFISDFMSNTSSTGRVERGQDIFVGTHVLCDDLKHEIQTFLHKFMFKKPSIYLVGWSLSCGFLLYQYSTGQTHSTYMY